MGQEIETKAYVNESNLDSLQYGPGVDRNIMQMQYSININTVDPYIFMDHTYFGSGGYRDGSYLIPFSRESSYLNRKQLAHFKNYLKPILRAMIEPVFTEEAIRSVKTESGQDITDSMFNEFLDDCDSADTSIQNFTQQIVSLARRHGVSFVVMDNYPSTAQPETVSQALEGRIFPYVYAKRAYEVEDYECDQFGNLVSITFAESPVKNADGSVQKRWRRWTQQESIVLTKNKNNSKEWVEISRNTHGLGVVPVIMCFSDARDCKTKILVDPPLYDIAKLNYVIFNQSAEIRDQERAQAFSIFYCQGVPPGDLVISNNTYINLPAEATISPGYASPDFNIIKGLVENQEQIRKDLYAIAEQAGVVGVQSQTSGVALAFDFWAHESTLKQTAKLATEVEEEIAELFMKYTNENFVYTVIYPSDYAPMGVDNEIQRFERVLKIPGINKKLAAKVQEKMARMLLADESAVTVQEVVDDIKSSSDDSVALRKNLVANTAPDAGTADTPEEGATSVDSNTPFSGSEAASGE